MTEESQHAPMTALMPMAIDDPRIASPLKSTLPERILSTREVLQIRTIRRLWYSQLISVFGDFLALYAVIGVLSRSLHEPQRIIVGAQIAYLLPVAVFGLISGSFVDRWPLRFTLVGSDLVRACLVLLLILAKEPWQFNVVLASISIVSSFFTPAQSAAIRVAVPAEGLRPANALMQLVLFGMRVVGPPAAAFLVLSFGPTSCYTLDSLSFIGSAYVIASVFFIKPDESLAQFAASREERRGVSLQTIWSDLSLSIRFIARLRVLVFVILAMATGLFMIGCFLPSLAVYTHANLTTSTKLFGRLSRLLGLGMLLGVLALNKFGKRATTTKLVYLGLLGLVAGFLLLTWQSHVLSSMLAVFVIGASLAAIIIPSQALVQQLTPPPLIGRVGALFMSTIFMAQVLGLALSGMLIAKVGPQHVFVLCAGLAAALVAAGWLSTRRPAQSRCACER
jgi:MFS family permease